MHHNTCKMLDRANGGAATLQGTEHMFLSTPLHALRIIIIVSNGWATLWHFLRISGLAESGVVSIKAQWHKTQRELMDARELQEQKYRFQKSSKLHQIKQMKINGTDTVDEAQWLDALVTEYEQRWTQDCIVDNELSRRVRRCFGRDIAIGD